MNTPWKTDKWFTSLWNFTDEVRKDMDFSKDIKIHDVTLRDGEQQSGIVFSKDQKVALAEKMAEMGIHRIEAGMPAVSKQDEMAIKEIVKRDLGPDIYAFARCMKEDVKRAVDCGVKHIVVEIPASEHIIKHAYKWELERAIEASVETTLYAKENGLYTVFFPIDGSRADMNWFLDFIEQVATHGHMDALACVDTMGGISPNAVPFMVRKMKERIDKPLEVHFHDDFGLASANTILALAAGADVAHTTIGGIGERAGNASYEDIVLSLLTMYDVDLGLKYENIYDLASYLHDIAKLPMKPNRGIIGKDISNIESGIVASWFFNVMDQNLLEVIPYDYKLTGHPDVEVVLGKNSGLMSIDYYLDKIALKGSKDQMMEILELVKEKSFAKSDLLNLNEFEEIAHKVID